MRQTLFETCIDMLWTQSSKLGLSLSSSSRACGQKAQHVTLNL